MSSIKAIKRLAKEAASMASDPPPFVSAAPLTDENLFEWRAVLAGVPGTPLEGVAVVLDLTFPPEYPAQPPNAGFLTPVPFNMGGSWTNAKGQQVLCLSLLGDAGQFHSEWAGAQGKGEGGSHGWSPATTVANLLVNLHALLLSGDECSVDGAEWKAAAATARRFKDAPTGHDGGKPATWWPPVKEYAAKAAAKAAEETAAAAGGGSKLAKDEEKAADEKGGAKGVVASPAVASPSPRWDWFEVFVAKIRAGRAAGAAAAPDDALLSALKAFAIACEAQAAAAKGTASSVDANAVEANAVEAKAVEAKAVEAGGGAAACALAAVAASASPPPLFPTPSAAALAAIDGETTCYVTLGGLEDGDALGFGIQLNLNQGKGGGGGGGSMPSCPCEVLSASAFYDSKVRESSYRSPIDAFLPLYLSPQHFSSVKKAGLLARVCGGNDLVTKLYGVMNAMVVSVSSGEQHASLVQMRGFAQLHRLLLALALDDATIIARARRRVDTFLGHPDSGCRAKGSEPNLGELIVAKLLVPEVSTAKNFLPALLEESAARNVKWYAQADPKLGLCDAVGGRERRAKVFAATAVSRQLLCFQAFFLGEFGSLPREQQAAKYDAWRGRPTPDQEARMQACWRGVKVLASFADFDACLGVAVRSEGQVDADLNAAVATSAARGYHSPGGGGKGRGGGGSGGGGGGGGGGGKGGGGKGGKGGGGDRRGNGGHGGKGGKGGW